ncbi:MAG: EAL domain-containing protein [Firmicutes bacterium]|nr:EAL domain-containing protein [Bacillota bacterium]
MARVRDACQRGIELTVRPVFQPIVELASGRIQAYEALSRLTDDKGSVVRPDDAFAAAEAGGYAAALDVLAIRAIASEAVRRLPPGARLFVNVSPATLLTCRHALKPLQPLADRVVLEITERRPIGRDEEQKFLRTLDALRSIGYRLAIDDLGDGYASLGRMLTLRPEYVKLGQSLVGDVEADPRRMAMVGSMVHFGARSGTTLVAEGIETQACYETLRGLGVELGQGYLFARPSPEFGGGGPPGGGGWGPGPGGAGAPGEGDDGRQER